MTKKKPKSRNAPTPVEALPRTWHELLEGLKQQPDNPWAAQLRRLQRHLREEVADLRSRPGVRPMAALAALRRIFGPLPGDAQTLPAPKPPKPKAPPRLVVAAPPPPLTPDMGAHAPLPPPEVQPLPVEAPLLSSEEAAALEALVAAPLPAEAPAAPLEDVTEWLAVEASPSTPEETPPVPEEAPATRAAFEPEPAHLCPYEACVYCHAPDAHSVHEGQAIWRCRICNTVTYPMGFRPGVTCGQCGRALTGPRLRLVHGDWVGPCCWKDPTPWTGEKEATT